MASRRFDAMVSVFAWVIVAFIFVAICAVVLGIRLVITGGDIGCAFAQDPALCIALKGVGR